MNKNIFLIGAIILIASIFFSSIEVHAEETGESSLVDNGSVLDNYPSLPTDKITSYDGVLIWGYENDNGYHTMLYLFDTSSTSNRLYWRESEDGYEGIKCIDNGNGYVYQYKLSDDNTEWSYATSRRFNGEDGTVIWLVNSEDDDELYIDLIYSSVDIYTDDTCADIFFRQVVTTPTVAKMSPRTVVQQILAERKNLTILCLAFVMLCLAFRKGWAVLVNIFYRG